MQRKSHLLATALRLPLVARGRLYVQIRFPLALRLRCAAHNASQARARLRPSKKVATSRLKQRGTARRELAVQNSRVFRRKSAEVSEKALALLAMTIQECRERSWYPYA